MYLKAAIFGDPQFGNLKVADIEGKVACWLKQAPARMKRKLSKQTIQESPDARTYHSAQSTNKTEISSVENATYQLSESTSSSSDEDNSSNTSESSAQDYDDIIITNIFKNSTPRKIVSLQASNRNKHSYWTWMVFLA